MGTRSSRYTRFDIRKPDPRLLPEAEIETYGSLAALDGTGSGKMSPSTRRERRAAVTMLRYHGRTLFGYFTKAGRWVKPKYPSRLIPTHSDAERLHGDGRKSFRK